MSTARSRGVQVFTSIESTDEICDNAEKVALGLEDSATENGGDIECACLRGSLNPGLEGGERSTRVASICERTKRTKFSFTRVLGYIDPLVGEWRCSLARMLINKWNIGR